MFGFGFFLNSVALGAGLAMDAFSVSIVNALSEPRMKKNRMMGIAAVYGFFQFLMPMLGWIAVHEIAQYFEAFQKAIPWIALLLLLYIGGKMLLEGLRHRAEKSEELRTETIIGFGTLIMQGVATSIDALSVGFAIANYGGGMAFAASLIIALVTFVICMGGLLIGRRVGEKITNKAEIFGGVILIAIGIEIFVTGIFH